ncbi:MAG: 50S ribosomal protein L18 [Candidatus Aenigmarchaeota archaeon]|nr:50S ribosomal protein L18 [Candidatus Aenigmarchaeota archaeon]
MIKMKRLKRRIRKKTNYHRRIRLLKSGYPRLVVRKSNNNILVQVVKYDGKSDKTIFSVLSKTLAKYNWFPKPNTPTAYLTGLKAGLEAKKRGIDRLVLDLDMKVSSKKTLLYAVAKGVKDSGVNIALDKDVVPPEDRIRGKHIADYAKSLNKKDEKFSLYSNMGVNPEEIESIFENAKNKILSEK